MKSNTGGSVNSVADELSLPLVTIDECCIHEHEKPID
jgi:hypothetical protein